MQGVLLCGKRLTHNLSVFSADFPTQGTNSHWFRLTSGEQVHFDCWNDYEDEELERGR